MKEFDVKECGKRMRKVRKEMYQGTVKEFCYDIEITMPTLYDCENGRTPPRAHVVFNMCQAFGVSADWLLGLTEEM